MTFAVSEGGTRDEVLAALEAISYGDPLAAGVRDAIAACLRSAASGSLESGEQLRYTVTASGHSAPGTVPALTVSLTGEYVQPPAGMSAYRDRLLSVGFIRGSRARVEEHRAEDGTRIKAVTDELDSTVTEHSRPGTGVSFRQDVMVRPRAVTMEDGI